MLSRLCESMLTRKPKTMLSQQRESMAPVAMNQGERRTSSPAKYGIFRRLACEPLAFTYYDGLG